MPVGNLWRAPSFGVPKHVAGGVCKKIGKDGLEAVFPRTLDHASTSENPTAVGLYYV